jgi:tetraacyldisaccharide 4'-kinase
MVRGSSVAFCGIARPENFFAQLRAEGLILSETRCFRDHHRYVAADILQLLHLRRNCGAVAFLTTEKDAINLGARMRDLEPVHVIPVRMELLDAEQKLSAMLSSIAERKSQRT